MNTTTPIRLKQFLHRLFDFRVQLASLYLDIDLCIGFQILAVESYYLDRGLISFLYYKHSRHIFISIFWFNFTINL